MSIRKWLGRGLGGTVARAACATSMVWWVAGCSAGMGSEDEGAVSSVKNRLGTYDLRSVVSDPLRADSRGWEVEWEIPLLNSPAGDGTLGQWYWNLESGVYHTGDGWFVYYFGDDNGLAGADPACDQQWVTGGMCGGVFRNLQPGQRVLFRYEYCTPSHVADVNGTQLCLYVDLEDGHGLRFLAEDGRSTDEMYTHDIENFEGQTQMQISCTQPSKMVKQRRKTSQGQWVNMTGAKSWRFVTGASTNHFQNFQVSAVPATWNSCSGAGASATCTDGLWNGDESGVDCGGSCSPCNTGPTCQEVSLPRAAAVASSQENASLAASYAIDGNDGTRWSSAFSDPQWIYVDLGTQRTVSRVNLSWETAASSNFDLEVSSSSSGPWTAVVTGATGGFSQSIPFTPTAGRYVRLLSHSRNTPYGNSIWEFDVQGDPSATCGQSASTCNDGLQNGSETGVDCGGTCAACPVTCLNQPLTRVAAVASSQENAGLAASYAIDGNAGTRWASAFADLQWIYVDLGSVQRVRRVVLNWETAASSHYEVQVAQSAAGPWSSIYSTTSGNGGVDDLSGFTAQARYVRMYSYSRTTGYGNSLWELGVYGDPNANCAP